MRGDSLRTYWRRYWRLHQPPARGGVPAVEVAGADSTDEESGYSASDDDDAAMRASVVAHESCLSALDSNRAVVKWALPVIGLYQDSLATERASIPYRAIGVSGGIGLGVGYILGKIF